jgi:hypothetical protein
MGSPAVQDVKRNGRRVTHPFNGDGTVLPYRRMIPSVGVIPNQEAIAFQKTPEVFRILRGQLTDGPDPPVS